MPSPTPASSPIVATRASTRLLRDPLRVITKPFHPGEQVFPDGQSRVQLIVGRILDLAEAEVGSTLASTVQAFEGRHRNLNEILSRNFDLVVEHIERPGDLSPERRLLIGAYFTHEYSIEAAALNNPSIVPAPDQTGVGPGEQRFIMSLRAIGEGHLSSIGFRSGVISPTGDLTFDKTGPYPTIGARTDAIYDKDFFTKRLMELGAWNEIARVILDSLADLFTIDEVEAAIDDFDRRGIDRSIAFETTRTLHWLASSNYTMAFEDQTDVSERVIFPAGPTESRGMEDARFVRFTHDDGSVRYYATYTAYDGFQILPQLIETPDFLTFRIATLGGIRATNKGMALFPRMIDGRYAALSRYDNQNNYVMFSDRVRFWDVAAQLQVPKRPWELAQVGNCGSPLETEAGWLVITHGVGPMRQYSLGAILLQIDDPQRVIGHLDEPLLVPSEDERDGYVPNVVYSCGAMVHGDRLVLPYGFADEATAVATIPLDLLLSHLT
ncbi:MAG TPA: glycoside hydrolase family 130 protein [Acidimicrobiia bacterium]